MQGAPQLPGGGEGGSALSDPALVEEGGRGAGIGRTGTHPLSQNDPRSPVLKEGVSHRDIELVAAMGGRGEGVLDGHAVPSGCWEGLGGLPVPLTRVLAVEEPWQSIYLWSMMFVKTTSDLRLFDSRTVRLFEVQCKDALRAVCCLGWAGRRALCFHPPPQSTHCVTLGPTVKVTYFLISPLHPAGYRCVCSRLLRPGVAKSRRIFRSVQNGFGVINPQISCVLSLIRPPFPTSECNQYDTRHFHH